MTNKVIYSKEFWQDIIAIGDYFERNDAPEAARKITLGIMASTDSLGDNPEMGKVFFLFGRVATKYRFIIHNRYVIFYTFRDEEIIVARVFDTRTDYISRMLTVLEVKA